MPTKLLMFKQNDTKAQAYILEYFPMPETRLSKIGNLLVLIHILHPLFLLSLVTAESYKNAISLQENNQIIAMLYSST